MIPSSLHKLIALVIFLLTNGNSIDVNRWQDGAIVANNPTIFAIREAQLLWPDTRIDSLVSIGCGSVPTKVIPSPSLVSGFDLFNKEFRYMYFTKSEDISSQFIVRAKRTIRCPLDRWNLHC